MGAVDTTYTFTATDTITSTKMNDIIDQTTITGDAILGTTLEVASGKLKVRSQGVTSNELATNAVTETKITDGSVTPAKLSAGSPSWTATTGFSGLEIGDGITTDTTSYIDLHSSSGVDYNARILRESGVNGNFVISNTGTGSIKFNDIPLGAQSGVAPIYGARAFGTVTSTGTALEASKGNVSGVSRTGVGAYTVTFSTPMISTSYVVLTTSRGASDSTWVISVGSRTVNSFSVVARFRDASGDIKSGDVDFSFAVFD